MSTINIQSFMEYVLKRHGIDKAVPKIKYHISTLGMVAGKNNDEENNKGLCLQNIVSFYTSGDSVSDRPDCVRPCVAHLGILLNDRALTNEMLIKYYLINQKNYNQPSNGEVDDQRESCIREAEKLRGEVLRKFSIAEIGSLYYVDSFKFKVMISLVSLKFIMELTDKAKLSENDLAIKRIVDDFINSDLYHIKHNFKELNDCLAPYADVEKGGLIFSCINNDYRIDFFNGVNNLSWVLAAIASIYEYAQLCINSQFSLVCDLINIYTDVVIKMNNPIAEYLIKEYEL